MSLCKRHTVLLAMTGVVVLAGCFSSDASRSAPKRLPDGFHVVAGTRLAGAAVPIIGPIAGHTRSWYALLNVDGDVRDVYRAFAAQATRHGLPEMQSADEACSYQGSQRTQLRLPPPTGGGIPIPPNPDDVTCSGFSPTTVDDTRSPMGLAVMVHVCRSCTPSVGLARIEYSIGAKPPREIQQPVRRTARPKGYAWTDEAWPVLDGARVLAQAEFDECQGSYITVLEVTGDPTKVWRRYVAGLSEIDLLDEAKVDGHEITQAYESPTGSTQSVTLIEGDDLPHPVLAVNRCDD